MDGIARVGISGWRYTPWRGVFYPKGLVQRRELEFAAERLDTVEINGSFYSLQRPQSFIRWRESTPPEFVFAVKGPRYITHMLRLREPLTALANFFASGVLALEGRLGPVLWQLPERHRLDVDELDAFLSLLPASTVEAAALAHGHDARLDGRDYLEAGEDVPIRHALEVRSPGFDSPPALEVLRRHGVALVVADAAGKWPVLREDTADFRYVRLHGESELYTSGYDDASLDRWAEEVRGWTRAGQDVYVYFDNDAKVRAPFDAMGLRDRLRRS
jgi:uncharacterized protein YecE (DUF72 family)